MWKVGVFVMVLMIAVLVLNMLIMTMICLMTSFLYRLMHHMILPRCFHRPEFVL